MTTICVVGAGPRGISVVERMCVNAVARGVDGPPVVVHLVDPLVGEGGRVWRVDQPHRLLMNTVAAQVSMFTDDSVDCAGPISAGPSLYEWAKEVGVSGWCPAPIRAQARALTPNSYPTRVFYGYYLRWVLRRLIRQCPSWIRIDLHRTRAVAVHEDPRTQVVELEDGTILSDVDYLVLAQGHINAELTAEEARFAEFAARGEGRVRYQPPANPADGDLSFVPAGEPVLLRGMGLNFFDYLDLLTSGRGGEFVRERDGTLAYRRSGAEPLLYAGSRRGIPYHARGENEKGATGRHEPRVLTMEVIRRMRARGAAEFRRDVWPLVTLEVTTVYYRALVAERLGSAAADAFVDRYLAAGDARESVPAEYGVPSSRRWDWARITRPYGERSFTSRAEFSAWLLDYLGSDLTEARRGNLSSPLKAALDVLRDLRNEIRLVVDHRGITGRSYRDELRDWYTPLNAFVSIGPPAQRIEEMMALIRAGVLVVLGPELRVRTATDGSAFLADSTVVPGDPVRVTTMIDARLPETDITRASDPLLRFLLKSGQARPYVIPDENGGYETGGLAVTRRPYRLVDAHDSPHPRRFAFGVPTESVHWVTAAGIRPGVNSVILSDSDAIARACLFGDRDPATAVEPGPVVTTSMQGAAR